MKWKYESCKAASCIAYRAKSYGAVLRRTLMLVKGIINGLLIEACAVVATLIIHRAI